MPTECERLIAETLRLDGEATQGPWFEGVNGDVVRTTEMFDYDSPSVRVADPRNPDIEKKVSDCILIASYRTSAPRLARMLMVAVDALTEIDGKFARQVLGDIEKIARDGA